MNLRKLGLILACLMLLIATAAHADNDQGAQPMGKMQTFFKSNHFGKDLGFSLGVKVWASEWSLPLTHPTGDNSKTVVTFKSDTEFFYIPSFMVRYRNFFIGGSYLPETEFDFGTQTLTEIGLRTLTTEVTADRKEWDLNVGYFITSNIALSLGYKSIDRDYHITDTYTGTAVLLPAKNPDKYTISRSTPAPIIGLSASFPIANQFSFNGNFAYGRLHDDYDGNYYFGELGLSYALPIKQMKSTMTFNVGYRFQRLDLEPNSSNPDPLDENDETSGITFGINLLF